VLYDEATPEDGALEAAAWADAGHPTHPADRPWVQGGDGDDDADPWAGGNGAAAANDGTEDAGSMCEMLDTDEI
jgi:hypothetical protein